MKVFKITDMKKLHGTIPSPGLRKIYVPSYFLSPTHFKKLEGGWWEVSSDDHFTSDGRSYQLGFTNRILKLEVVDLPYIRHDSETIELVITGSKHEIYST